MRQKVQGKRAVAGLVAALAMSGCMTAMEGAEATRNADGAEATAATPQTANLNAQMADDSTSAVIEGLMSRRSVLASGPLAQVADAVLDANTRAAEAELRAAVLRAEATQLNWLPTLGPQVSLNSLGDLVSSLVLDAVLWDNGAKRAERDHAKADVEVAAVALAEDTNERVLAALELYLTAEAAKARANVNAAAMERMNHFAYVMRERVNAGVNDRADLSLVTQRLNQMQSDLSSDRETAASAMAELSAMSARPLSGIGGLSGIGQPSALDEPLGVAKAQAEATRAVAEAVIARSGYLPGVSVQGTATNSGSDAAITVGAPNGLGFGRGANLEAIEAQRAAADARVGEARETANRELRGLEGQLASLIRQESQAQSLAAEAARNYELFAQQQAAGRRAVPDVVGVFETKVRTEREAVSLKYDIAKLRLRIAAVHGALVDGGRI